MPLAPSQARRRCSIWSPTSGQNSLAALHEGISSYNRQPNWWPDAAARKQIAKDTAVGVATAGLGHGTAELAPKLLPEAVKWVGVQGVPAGLAAHYLDQTFGKSAWTPWAPSALFGILNKPGDWARTATEKIADQPATQNVIKLASQGAGSALRSVKP